LARSRVRLVCGLDYTFTLSAFAPLGAARLVSTPSRQPFGWCAWLGIASEGFPEFEQFCTSGFPEGTQSLKSLASTSSAMPALATDA
jgi:hypothetical protein